MFQIVKFKPLKKRRGKVLGLLVIMYHDLELTCQLRATANLQDFWIKMPTKKIGKIKEININNWPSKEHSDIFQNTIKELVHKQFPELVDGKMLTDIKEKSMTQHTVGKARTSSRFR